MGLAYEGPYVPGSCFLLVLIVRLPEFWVRYAVGRSVFVTEANGQGFMALRLPWLQSNVCRARLAESDPDRVEYGDTKNPHVQSVSHRKHKQSLFTMRATRSTQIHSLGSPYLTGNTLRLRCKPKSLMFGETVAVYCENDTEHTDTLCGQSAPHRKHITSPLQKPAGQFYRMCLCSL
jgi:hypothetical protein